MKFQDKLTLLRKKQKMTQEELAAALGVSRQSVSKWELGTCEPELSKLRELSRVLGVSADFLLDDTKEEEALLCDDEEESKQKEETEIFAEPPRTRTQSANLIPAALILVGGIGLIVSIVIAFLNPHYSCWLKHKWIPNIMGYIIADWCEDVVLWRFGLFLPSLACIFGVLIYYYKERNKIK